MTHDWKKTIKNDYNSFLRKKYFMTDSLNKLANSNDEKYLIVYCNIIINCYNVGFCDCPWTYFESINIPNIGDLLNKFINENPGYIFHNYFNPGQCRSIRVENRELIESQYKQLMMCRSTKMTQKREREYRLVFNEMSDEQDKKYFDNPTIEYISYLNNVTMPKCIINNCTKALFAFPDYRRELIIDLHQKLHSHHKYIISPEKQSINYRIGGLFSNLPLEIRRFILNEKDGFIELDLKSAHLSFLCAKMNLKLPENVVQLIADETELLKSRVKECVVRTIYGGKYSPKDGLILDQERKNLHDQRRTGENPTPCKNQDQEINDYNKICSNEYFIKIKDSVKKLHNEIELNNGIVDAFGIFLTKNENIKSSTIMAAYYSSFEKKLLMKLLPVTHEGFRIISDEHDGCTIFILNPNRKDEIIKKCKDAVNKEAKKLGINTTLEVK